MAISAVHYQLLKEHAHLLKRGGSLLEIGEANWYGDADPWEILKDIHPAGNCNYLLDAIEAKNLFSIAKAVYRTLFAPSIVEAVDLSGTPGAFIQDLNGPLDLPRRYDTVINHGTAEHIFQIAQVFASIHQWTVPGGYMIHESPFTGWVDHGFYCLQPTLFYDLAAANDYELVSLSVTEIASRTILRVESREHFHSLGDEIPDNALLFVVLKKTTDLGFRIPVQGYYDGRLSDQGRRAWYARR